MDILPALPTSPATLVDHYWANFLGCEVEQLLSDDDVYPIAGPTGPSIWAMARRQSWVVSVPPEWPFDLRQQCLQAFQPAALPDAAALQTLLTCAGDHKLYGPAIIMLHQAPDWHYSRSALVRALDTADQAQVAAFQVAASPIYWTLDEPTIWPKVFGVFCDEQLVAACAVRIWGELLAEIYIDTLPTHRRRGYGKAATEAAIHWIRTETPYQAESVIELTNVASWRLMMHAGFSPYAYMLTSFGGS